MDVETDTDGNIRSIINMVVVNLKTVGHRVTHFMISNDPFVIRKKIYIYKAIKKHTYEVNT